MLGLDYEEQGNYLRKLPVGHGFMLRRMSEFHEPFLVEFPFVPVKKGSVSDEDIKRHMVGKIPVVCEERRKVAREARTILPEDVDAAGLKIIEVLGTARGVFTSQIYKEIKMSGAAFNDKVKGLLSMGAVGVRAAKIKKNRLNYYFLTEEGETLFEGNFGQVKRKTEINSEEIMDILTTGGWNAKLEGDRIVLEGEGKKLDIVLVSDFDRKGLLGHFHDGARYFLCASEFFQNLVLQQAARFCYETGKTITIFINMGKTFTDKGNFEKIEFV
jgi:hypothetical protein